MKEATKDREMNTWRVRGIGEGEREGGMNRVREEGKAGQRELDN